MATISEEQVLSALKSVSDLDRDEDIVSLGMVSGLVVKDGNVGFSLEIDPRSAQAYEPLRREAEEAVDGIPGVLSVTAVLTAHKHAPQQQASPQQPQGGPQQAKTKQAVPGIEHIVAVASGKGGVGKSTVATNLALALAAGGHSVGILDADIYGPSQPRMMGISGKPQSPDGARLEAMENYGIKVMSMGFLVPEDTPMIWRGPMVMSALQQLMRDVNWGELDVLVVDMPPGTGDAQLTMAQDVPLAGAVIVSTPQDIALLDARKGLNMFRKVEVPVLGIIENMSYFACPHCGERTDIFSHGGAREESDRLGVDFLGEIPLDMAIRETSDGGRPIVISDPENAHSKAFCAIADRIWDKLDGGADAPGRAMPNIVMQ